MPERAQRFLEWQRTEGGRGRCEVHADGTEVVVLDPGLLRVDRCAVLAQELGHLLRGLLPTGTPPAIVSREEHQVASVAARRLVPVGELVTFIEARADEPVTVADIAEEFDVPHDVVELAVAHLLSTITGFAA